MGFDPKSLGVVFLSLRVLYNLHETAADLTQYPAGVKVGGWELIVKFDSL
jgi:hypothetical protein